MGDGNDKDIHQGARPKRARLQETSKGVGPVDFAGTEDQCLYNEDQKVYAGAGAYISLKDAVKREWPSLTGLVFVPEVYYLSRLPHLIYPDYKTREDFQNVVTEDGTVVTDKMVKKLDNISKNGKLTGDTSERHIFEKIKNFFKDVQFQAENLAIIHGWRCKDFHQTQKEREADFFIVSSSHRIIVNVEVKHKYTKSSATKVSQQNYNNKKMLEDILGELVEEKSGWKFVGCGAYYQHEEAPEGTFSNPYVLFQDSDMAAWWKECTKTGTFPDDKAYSEIVARLVACMYLRSSQDINKNRAPSVIATRGQASDRAYKDLTEKVGTAKNVIMWTRSQYRILHSSATRLILNGRYGTGKTILLRQKCEDLARQHPEKQFVFVVTLREFAESESLLFREVTNYYQEKKLDNVDVIKISQSEHGFRELLREVIKHRTKNEIGGIFVDEIHVYKLIKLMETGNRILGPDEDGNRQGHFWVALRYGPLGFSRMDFDKEITEFEKKYRISSHGFCLMMLDEVMRNSLAIIKEAYRNQTKQEPSESNLAPLPSRRVWTEGKCIKMDPRPSNELKGVLSEALDLLPSKDNILVYLNDNIHQIMHDARSLTWPDANKLAKTVLDEKGVPCIVLDKDEKSVDLDTVRRGATIYSKGLWLTVGLEASISGTEFKSLIYVGDPGNTSESWNRADIFSRCLVNLVIVPTYNKYQYTRTLK